MRQRIKKEFLSASSATPSKTIKRKRSGNPATAPTQQGINKVTRSKQALKKLLNNKIAYKLFTRLKERLGIEGNYWKLIYNTPKS